MHKWRNRCITIFVVIWSLAFHYESLRTFYLEPLANRSLPKIKFLFPPAGWIMFFRVDEAYGHVSVYGFKNKQAYEIDPHEIFRVRTIGYDNIHRGVISSAASSRNRQQFCRQLYRRFEGFESFRVHSTYYPKFITDPFKRHQQILYSCVE